MPRDFGPLEAGMQVANAKTIVCKDCIYRDKTTFEFEGKIYDAGSTKCRCLMYSDHAGKPSEILFMNAPCKFYAKDETAR